ncbi:hypothetical protein ACIBI3_20950 [Actinomadura luteofluorescens]|uniref:hypothetical protein n=1 Tax=Actinomadura luteofluorescens TaxID=46163 RepID=UPI00347B1557
MRVMPRKKSTRLALAGTAATAAIIAGTVSVSGGPSTSTASPVSANGPASKAAAPHSAGGKAKIASTASDCEIREARKPYVSGGYLRSRTTIHCGKSHNIRLFSYIQLGNWPYTLRSEMFSKDFRNFKGTAAVDSYVPCNEVSPKTKYRAHASFSDITFMYPIDVEDDNSTLGYGC